MPSGLRGNGREASPGCRAVCLAILLLILLPALPIGLDPAPLASAQEEGPGNLLLNPGFERAYDDPTHGPKPVYWQLDPWSPAADTVARQDARYHHNGSHSLLLEVHEGTGTEEVMWYQVRDLGPNRTFAMGGFVRTDLDEGARVVLRARFLRDNDRELDRWELVVEDEHDDWVEYRLPPGPWLATDRVRFELALEGTGSVWFDDVYFGEPTDMDNPPFIVSVPPLHATVGHEYTYRPRAVDLEGDPVTFGIYRGPEGMAASPDGCLTWTPDSLPEGAVKVVVTATDPGGHVSYQDFFLSVRSEPLQRPVHVLLYSTYDDPFNNNISGERYLRVLPMVQDLWEGHADLVPSVTVLMSGTESGWATASRADALSNISRLAGEGLVELGYSGFFEPTFHTNPLYDPDYGEWSWSERVRAVDRYLSIGRNPINGEEGHGWGGLVFMNHEMGNVSALAGFGADGAQMHALSRFDAGSVVLGIEGGPSGPGALGVDPDVGTLVAMLSEDPAAPRGLYWQAGRLVAAMDEAGVGAYAARLGPGGLDGAVASLDRRWVNVLPVLVADVDTYCNGSKVVGGDQVLAPADWAWSHPDSRWLPAEATRSPEERGALYDATCTTLLRLAEDVLPATGGRFCSAPDLSAMVDAGSGVQVSSSELAAAANDLVGRRTLLRYPEWVGLSWGYCRGDYQYFSLADMYCLLVRALEAYNGTGRLPGTVDLSQAYGPRSESPPSQPWNRLRLGGIVSEAARQAERFEEAPWRLEPRAVVPSTSSVEGVGVNAMEFLLLMAETYLLLFEGDLPADPLVSIYPTLQWPLTRTVLEREGRPTDMGDSWTLRPASSNLQLDEEPPTVRYVSPAHGSVNVPLGTNVTVIFSERMDETMDLGSSVVIDPVVAFDARWDYHRLVVDPRGDLVDNTTYTVTLRRSLRDVAGNPLAQEVTWSFSTVGLENAPPKLNPWPTDPDVEVEENQTVRLGVLADDDGPPPLRYSWLVDGVLVAGEVGDSLEIVPSYNDAGEHTVTVVVSDSADPPGTSTFTWNLTVVNVNIPPVLLGRTPANDTVYLDEAEGSVEFSVWADDPDEGMLVLEWWMDDWRVTAEHLSDDGSVFHMPLGFERAGEHEVACRVVDSEGEGFTVEWHVVVRDVNRPPVLHDVVPALPLTVEVDETVTVVVNATDPDGDALNYTWEIEGGATWTTEDHTWLFTPTADGAYHVTILVSDGRGGTQLATVTVNAVPGPSPAPPMQASSILPWALVAAIATAIAVALLWPRLGRRMEG